MSVENLTFDEELNEIFREVAYDDAANSPDLTPRDYLFSDEKNDFDRSCILKVLPLTVVPAALGVLAIVGIDHVNPIFRQTRVGYQGEPIEIMKFRTMPKERNHIPSIGGHEDVRRSSVGRILSKLRIDEVPQLLSIWRGEMSVIGPRPHIPADYAAAVNILGKKRAYEWFRDRTQARPGAFSEFDVLYYANALEGDAEAQLLKRHELESRYIFETASRREDRRIMDMGRLVARSFVARVISGGERKVIDFTGLDGN